MSTVSTRNFDWNKQTKTFVSFASDLGTLRMEQVYPDACDAGFTLVSERTGVPEKVVEFAVEVDSEGDLICTKFKPLNPKLDFTVIIFND